MKVLQNSCSKSRFAKKMGACSNDRFFPSKLLVMCAGGWTGSGVGLIRFCAPEGTCQETGCLSFVKAYPPFCTTKNKQHHPVLSPPLCETVLRLYAPSPLCLHLTPAGGVQNLSWDQSATSKQDFYWLMVAISVSGILPELSPSPGITRRNGFLS